jgi:hypothetical protein
MFNIEHDLDALLIAVLGITSLLWLGRNIYVALKDIYFDHQSV